MLNTLKDQYLNIKTVLIGPASKTSTPYIRRRVGEKTTLGWVPWENLHKFPAKAGMSVGEDGHLGGGGSKTKEIQRLLG